MLEKYIIEQQKRCIETISFDLIKSKLTFKDINDYSYSIIQKIPLSDKECKSINLKDICIEFMINDFDLFNDASILFINGVSLITIDCFTSEIKFWHNEKLIVNLFVKQNMDDFKNREIIDLTNSEVSNSQFNMTNCYAIYSNKGKWAKKTAIELIKNKVDVTCIGGKLTSLNDNINLKMKLFDLDEVLKLKHKVYTNVESFNQHEFKSKNGLKIVYANWCLDSLKFLKSLNKNFKDSDFEIILLDVKYKEDLTKKFSSFGIPQVTQHINNIKFKQFNELVDVTKLRRDNV